MRRTRAMAEWPAYWYGPDGESEIFNGPEEVPDGWVSKPGQVYEAVEPKEELCKETLIKQLKDRNIEIDPTWGKAKLNEVLNNE